MARPVSLLLDTHVLLWWAADDTRLGPRARAAVAGDEVFVSAVTAWEIEIKRALGRLTAPEDLASLLVEQSFRELPLTLAHAAGAGRLARHHDDPFDRALVAQAQVEGLRLVTADASTAAYEVRRLDARR